MNVDYEKIIKERRFRVIYFDSPDMCNFFIVDSDDTYPLRIKNNGLPDDHIILSVWFGVNGKNIACFIASETFESVPDDCEIERLHGTDQYQIKFLEMGKYKLRI